MNMPAHPERPIVKTTHEGMTESDSEQRHRSCIELEKLQEKVDERLMDACYSLYVHASESDKVVLARAFSELAVALTVSEEELVSKIFSAIKNDPKQTFMAILSRNPSMREILLACSPELLKEFQNAQKRGEAMCIDDIVLEEDLAAAWPILEAYLRIRKQREEKEQQNRLRTMSDTPELFSLSDVQRLLDAGERGSSPDRERMLDAVMLNLILRSSYVDQGNNGVILKLNERELDEASKRIARELGLIDAEGEQRVIKILKVYVEGAGERERDNQQVAHRITEGAIARGIDTARVPAVYHARDIAIPNTQLAELLKKRIGLQTVGTHIGCIMMEYLEGEDLATHIWKAYGVRVAEFVHSREQSMRTEDWVPAIQRATDFFEVRELLRDMQRTYQPVFTRYGRALQFLQREPVTEVDVQRERVMEVRNADLIVSTLRESGYRLDSRIIDRIRNAIGEFRKEGFVYLDAHERNVMLVGDEVFLIDFGQCRQIGRPVTGEGDSDAFRDMQMNPSGQPMDMRVVHFLESLSR